MARTATDSKLRLGILLTVAGLILMVGSIVAPAASGWTDKARGHGVSAGRGHGNGKGGAAFTSTTAATTVNGNGANHTGPYDPWGVGEPSGNGNGNTGECAGCNGSADGKHPPGQSVDGSDHNNGYECDGNRGIAKTNPAHSRCFTPATTPSTTTPPTTVTTTPPSTTTPSTSTSTTAPPESTTTTLAAPTTTVEVGASTTTPVDEVLGVQVERGRALPRTGTDLAAIAFLGLALTSAGLVILGLRQRVGQSGNH